MQIDVNRPVKFIWIVFNPSYELSLFPTFFGQIFEKYLQIRSTSKMGWYF